MLIDTHCHLFKHYYEDLEEVIEKMAGNHMIVIGINHETNKEVLQLCETYPNIYGTLGIHPSEVEGVLEEHFSFIEKHIHHPKIVGIGEAGLDYYWTTETKEKQFEVFQRQIELSEKYQKTLVIHSRSAKEDTYRVLKESYDKKTFPFVMHCFSYDLENAKQYIAMGALLGIGGAVTYKKSLDMIDVVKNIDLSHILLETDSPYLTPNPYRGKRNEPVYVASVAEEIAKIKNISYDKVAKDTSQNAIRQFDLNGKL